MTRAAPPPILSIRLSPADGAGEPLTERAAPQLALTPYLALDVAEVALTPERLRELELLDAALRERWGEATPGLLLIRADAAARDALAGLPPERRPIAMESLQAVREVLEPLEALPGGMARLRDLLGGGR